MRKLIYYIAISTDGFIAQSDGSFDVFPMQGEHITDLIADYPETMPAPARAALNYIGGFARDDSLRPRAPVLAVAA